MSRVGRVYRLTDGVLDYIGSTIQALSQRKAHHKDTANKKYGRSSQVLFESGRKVTIHELEQLEVSGRHDLRLRDREQYWMEQFPDRVNKNNAVRTMTPAEYGKLYRAKNKALITKKHKAYYEKNKDKIAKKNAIRYALKNADPAWRERKRKYDREYYRKRKLRQKLNSKGLQTPPESPEAPRLSPQPSHETADKL